MEAYSTGRKIWGVIYPVFLYLMVQIVARFLVGLLIGIWYLIKNGFQEGQEIQQILLQEMQEQSVFMLFISTIAAIPVFCFLYRRDSRSYAPKEPKQTRWASYLWLVPLSAAAYLLAYQFINEWILYLPQSSVEEYAEVSGRLTSGSLWIQLPAVLVLAPIVEELLFRGLVFRRLAELIGSLGGMIGSAFLFGLFHGNLIQGSYAFLVGILLAWVYSRYGTVIAPILVHIWMNIAAELLRLADMKAVLYANTAVFILFLLGEAAVVAICCIGISRMGVKKEERHV